MDWFISLVAIISLYIAYGISLAAYRLCLHPLSRFPGPPLAAITYWHEVYHDIVRPGMLIWEVDKYHNKYGSVVRISPDELHIRDSRYFDTLYTKAGRMDRYAPATRRFDNPTSAFSTPDAELHALRRAPLTPFFSRAKINSVEPLIMDKIEILQRHLREYQGSGQIIRMDRAFSALTGDIIMEYAFAIPSAQLDSPDFEDTLLESIESASRQGSISVHFPMIPFVMKKLPRSWLLLLQPLFYRLFKMQDELRAKIIAVKKFKPKHSERPADASIFSHLLNDSSLSQKETSIKRLQDEAQTIVGAGVGTTARALSVATFHITNDPEIYTRLHDELVTAIRNPARPPTWAVLEKLPYLSGCVRESVRLAYSVSGRNARVLNKSLRYRDWILPAGTPVSMTLLDVALDAEIFPEPDSFRPERWMNNPKTADGISLERFMVSFGKGSRSCIGINLAYAELYLTLAMIFRTFRFELYETDISDVEIEHDFFMPQPKLDSKGIRMKCVKDS